MEPGCKEWTVPGFTVGAAASGMKKQGALDIAVICSDRPCAAAGVFTRNRIVGEPVKLDRRHLRHPTHRAIVVNAKVSNVCTGPQGARNARDMAQSLAQRVGCEPRETFVASTGVIGAQLPMDKINAGIDKAAANLSPNGWHEAARAIMTTDTRPKMARRRLEISGRKVTLAGIAKGSGMIHPNMATMLSFIATDASIDKTVLQDILRRTADRSFNCVTVDGDTSTSDTVLVLANGAAGNRKIARPGKAAGAFEDALLSLCAELAREIARDGEGAEHLVTVSVRGARNETAARRIAHTIATSPLVKTAIAGQDANWGRITAAAGRAGVAFRPDEVSLRLNGFTIFDEGRPTDFDEVRLTDTLVREEIEIDLTVGQGPGRATVWTCDLTEDYIRINADYRT